MTSFIDIDDHQWSDASSSTEDDSAPTALQPRAYQIEMFEQSLKQNTIVIMETGSGKTMIARLRIEAELERYPGKRIWFTTPTVELAKQQLKFLERQLPAFSFTSITGREVQEFWTSQDVWDAALCGKHGVVSTPAILRDALQHAFVSLEDISLLVIDEAHHAMKQDATNQTMQLYYHPLRNLDPARAPQVLALTATAMNSNDLALIAKLEQNLHALCRSPMIHVEEYRRFVHLPTIVRLDYTLSPDTSSSLLSRLESVVENYKIEDDPCWKRLHLDKSLQGIQKLEELVRSRSTFTLRQLRSFNSHANFMQGSLGPWATDQYIRACIVKLQRQASKADGWSLSIGEKEKLHLRKVLENVIGDASTVSAGPSQMDVSHKVQVLAKYLREEHHQGSACILFVERRSTAWALRVLLERMPGLGHCRFFSFVGTSSTVRSDLVDLADGRAQDEGFADFRAGKRDICIATQVMEEGIDIMACDSVICFDHPSNVRSFIQRRGRARRPGSKFAVLHGPDDKLAKYELFSQLEEGMKEIYRTRKRQLEDLEASEALTEHCDRLYRVPTTGATLTITNARQHLHHFCATLPKRTGRPEASPIYLLEGIHGESLDCRVILPTSLPAELQEVRALSSWRTEKMAKMDAAFEAYKKLYEAGLINEHLLPPVVERSQETTVHEQRESVNEVGLALDPWEPSRQQLSACGQLYAHRISIAGSEELPSMLLLLPSPVLYKVEAELFVSSTCRLTVRTDPLDGVYDVEHDLANQITKFLFSSTLARRLPGLYSDDYGLPYYLLPDIGPGRLQHWLNFARQLVPLSSHRVENNSTYVLLKSTETVLYLFDSHGSRAVGDLEDDETIQATKLTKRLDFSQPTLESEPRVRSLNVGECTVSGLPPGYVKLMVFIPTIMHQIELHLRARIANEDRLKTINFQNSNLVQSALTAPGANGRDNFQRLEYLGDALLKFHSTINVFCNNSGMPESQLTFLRDKIVNNTRLLRSTMELGLDAYLTTKAFSGHQWTLKTKEKEGSRKLSSKTLADVIEALIGAAYVDDSRGDDKVLKALSLFFPDTMWNLPATDISNLVISETNIPANSERLSHAEGIIGYTFRNSVLLAEALTHSTVQTGVQSYERLEFLGDAVIDVIVKERLFQSSHAFDEGGMHTRHIGLVNKDILAYLATKNAVEIEENTVSVDFGQGRPVVEKRVKKRCLHDFAVRLDTEEAGRQRDDFLDRYKEKKEKIDDALEHDAKYPWSEIYALNSPKWCSDIFESIVGAVFVDSSGELDTCRQVLGKLGLMALVERAAEEGDMDFWQPMRKIREMWAGKGCKVEVKKFKGDEDGDGDREERRGRGGAQNWAWACRIKIAGEVKGLVKGCACQAEAESRCAEVVLMEMTTNSQDAERGGGDTESDDLAEEEGLREGGRKRKHKPEEHEDGEEDVAMG